MPTLCVRLTSAQLQMALAAVVYNHEAPELELVDAANGLPELNLDRVRLQIVNTTRLAEEASNLAQEKRKVTLEPEDVTFHVDTGWNNG